MVTVQKLRDALDDLIAIGAGDTPVYAVCGSNGVSYEISSTPYEREVRDSDDAGPLCEIARGTPVVIFTLD